MIGPGRLILVVGPSGAGKDTLLKLARAHFAGNKDIVFPRRVVTREASSFEDNQYLSHEDFRQARAHGEFALHWEAHGHCYGLHRAIDKDSRMGRTVVINVSRTVVGAIRRAYATVTVVLVTAPPETLAKRLAMRARSSDGNVLKRVNRNVDDVTSPPDFTINNVSNVQDHAQELVSIVNDHCYRTMPIGQNGE